MMNNRITFGDVVQEIKSFIRKQGMMLRYVNAIGDDAYTIIPENGKSEMIYIKRARYGSSIIVRFIKIAEDFNSTTMRDYYLDTDEELADMLYYLEAFVVRHEVIDGKEFIH